MEDSGFWDIAYRDNAPSLLGVLRRYVKEVSIAQDLLHEVFITAIDKYDSYMGKGSFEGWLHRITVNTALMYLRNERNKQVSADAVLSVMDDDDADERSIDGTRAMIEAACFSGEELLAAIDRLPEHHKLVFNMYVMDDFSHKQIGTELNISPGTSKSHLARARKKIQQFLYDDALNKKKIKDRRWASAFLLLFPAKKHYIDRLYQEGLSHFTLPPTGGAEFLSAAIEQQAATVASSAAQAATTVASTATQTVVSTVTQTVSTAVFWGSKLSYIAACCGTAAVTGTVCWLSMGDNSPLNRDNDQVIVSDTLIYSSKPVIADSTTFNAVGHDSFIPSDPVDPGVASAAIEFSSQDNPVQESTSKPVNSSESPSTAEAKPEPVSQEPSNKQTDPNSSTEKVTAPVVVKKQVIQHQTVVVRDTIVITE